MGDDLSECLACNTTHTGVDDVHLHYADSLDDRSSCRCTTSEELETDTQVDWVYDIINSICVKLAVEELPYVNAHDWLTNTTMTRYYHGE